MTVWIFCALIFFLIEILNPETLCWIFLTATSLLAFFLSLIGVSFAVQCVVFIASSIGVLFWWLKRASKSPDSNVPTNLDRLIGKHFISTSRIYPLKLDRPSCQKFNGVEWSVFSEDKVIEKGVECVIIYIDGTKIIVKEVK